MTREQKDLLLKDLCARLPYEVRCKFYNVYENCYEEGTILGFERKEYIEIGGRCVNVEEVRPYLFPLSSMTEELKNFIRWKLTTPKYDSFDEESLEDLFHNNIQVVYFCYEHHLDISGLIEKGLAIDATGLNIY